MNVIFYDISPDDHLALAAKMASAAWGRKKHLIIREDTKSIDALDLHLWTFEARSFLPHERHREGHPLQDPEGIIVLVDDESLPIPADILLQLAPAPLAYCKQFQTVIDLVDHRSPERLQASRDRYRAWMQEGIKPRMRNKV